MTRVRQAADAARSAQRAVTVRAGLDGPFATDATCSPTLCVELGETVRAQSAPVQVTRPDPTLQVSPHAFATLRAELSGHDTVQLLRAAEAVTVSWATYP